MRMIFFRYSLCINIRIPIVKYNNTNRKLLKAWNVILVNCYFKTSHKTDSNSAIMGNYVCIVVGVVNQLR